jgi:WD40 repeat protein
MCSPDTQSACAIKPPVHTDAVTALTAVRPGMVLSGSRDKQILLNNIDTGECVLKWRGHEREVTKVSAMEENTVIISPLTLAHNP